jgi:hypothetical protein
MKLAACALAVVLASCASESEQPSGGTNPPTLWLAMSAGSTSQMTLVAEEPRPY